MQVMSASYLITYILRKWASLETRYLLSVAIFALFEITVISGDMCMQWILLSCVPFVGSWMCWEWWVQSYGHGDTLRWVFPCLMRHIA